jgi:nucleotide-binding universal stress UspA family protein
MNGDFTADEPTARAALDRILMPWRALFPDVPVRAVLRYSDPETALTAESVGAALVVVGSRGRGVLRGRLFGSVSRAVVQRAHSAVAVVRPDGAVAPRAVQRRRRASRTTDVASGVRPHGD